MIAKLSALSVLSLATLAAPCAQAASAADEPILPQAVTVYAGQGVDLNLREVPGAIFKGDLKRESTYFAGVSYGRTLGTLGGSIDVLRGSLIENVQHGYEAILLQHHGKQDNAELGAAYLLRTPDAELGPVRVNFATGAGISHAFGTPTYEDTPNGEPDKHYRTQLLALFEFEWKLAAAPQLSLVTRLHHRSGVYGLIAPRRVGSNFVVAGLRYRF